MAKKVWGKMMVSLDGQMQEHSFSDYGQIMDFLSEVANEEGTEVIENSRIRIYNVVGAVLDSKLNHFGTSFEHEAPDLGDACEGTTDEWEYEVHDTGRKFDDIDDLKDYLQSLVESGEYTVKEVGELEIAQTMTNTINFEDATDGEVHVKLDFEHGTNGQEILDGYHGRQYVLADEAEKLAKEQINEAIQRQLNDADLVNVRRDPQAMSEQEINEEMSVLQERLFELQMEKKHRPRVGGVGCDLGHIKVTE